MNAEGRLRRVASRPQPGMGRKAKHEMRIGVAILSAVILSWLLAGCAGYDSTRRGDDRLYPQVQPFGAEPAPPWAMNVPPGKPPGENPPASRDFLKGDTEYLLRSGDALTIRFIHNPELGADVTVRPDGKIVLPLVGEMAVEGLTVPRLHQEISRRYQDFTAATGYGELLKEGDYLEFRFVYNPELNIGVRIRSDGKICLPLLGDVQAAGLAPAALRDHLKAAYAQHIRNPDVALLVGETTAKKVFAAEEFITLALAKHADRLIFVGGEVYTPKVVRFEGQISTLQAIMQAGGVKETGDLSQVVVVRAGQFETGVWIKTDLSQPLQGRSIRNDVVLHNGDVVVVPMSGIAKVDLFVKQYIRELLPIQSMFSISVTPLGATVQ